MNTELLKFKCAECERAFSTKSGLTRHFRFTHLKDTYSFNRSYSAWNKGKTKSDDSRIKDGGETLKRRIKEGIVIPKGHIPSEESKKKISDSMKKAHKEGRAWNIGKSRWNNKPSYPEKFFIEVIKNEFEDKNYIREFSAGIYSIDFAWPHKMIALEIDGHQHERFEEYIERDKRKDDYLKLNKWTVLRIKWSSMFKDTKDVVQKLMKEFNLTHTSIFRFSKKHNIKLNKQKYTQMKKSKL